MAETMSTNAGRRGPELIKASRPFAQESAVRSWFEVFSTFAVWGLATLAAGLLVGEMGRGALSRVTFLVGNVAVWQATFALFFSVIAGLTIVRIFIVYHDHFHAAMLPRSKAARWLLTAYGMIVLVPPRVWRQTHNYHHAHTAKIVGSHVGSYPVVTLAMWQKMTWSERLMYRAMRHPLTILFGYLTVFMLGMIISPLRRDFRKNWTCALSLLIHATVAITLLGTIGWQLTLFTFFIPIWVSHTAGAYLFYAQHNFEDIVIRGRHEWEYTEAALHSSSYMKTGKVLEWFTGNIGYHHVHHLNPAIPFYRLPETMAALPELQEPHVTTLNPWDIEICFRGNIWDETQRKLISYREADTEMR